MKQYLLILSLLLIIKSTLVVASDLKYFFPEEIKKFNPKIPTPKEYFGFDIGQQYLSYDKTVAYLREIAQKSDRIKIIQQGFSYERKPLVFLLISTEKNLANIDQIRKNHLDHCNPAVSEKMDTDSLKLISWLSYSIHGNEASGVNAAVVVAYLLAASDDLLIKNILENTVIMLQPALNPDGVQKYASWANSNMAHSENSDENSRQFHEPGPSSRFNHYWFDLNRDWLFVQHPESYHRMKLFYQWRPTILNDYHERENTSGSFFSPGIKKNTNHLIPDENWALTEKMANYHSTILDKIGTLYFTKENYDDFYTGKGATLTDLTGGIGILYEQPNPKGLVRKVENVEIRFVDMIRNQVYCSASALKAGYEMKNELLNYQKNFYIEQKKLAEKDPVKGYVFGNKADISTTKELFKILKTHCITTYKLNKTIKPDEHSFEKDYAYVVPCNQQNYAVIKTIFEKVTNFKDSMEFYDVSTWTIPLGINIDYSELTDISGVMGDVADSVITTLSLCVPLTNYAYLFELSDYYSYRFLYYLQDKGLNVKVADAPFKFNVEGSERQFNAGTIMIPVREQSCSKEKINQIINEYADDADIWVFAVNSGIGIDFDLGSNHFKRITKPVVAIVTKEGADFNAIGELWHLLDYRFRIPVSLIDVEHLEKINLHKYNTIVFTESIKLSNEMSQKLVNWSAHNTLITIGTAYTITNKLGLSDIHLSTNLNQQFSPTDTKYADYNKIKRETTISGVVLDAKMDLTHPITYGLSKEKIPFFKRGNIVISSPKIDFITPVYYSNKPLLSGYIEKKHIDMIKGSPAILAGNNVIYFVDNPYFRAYWLGSSRLFLNSIFFRDCIAKEKVLTN